jgi:hypothetical protein
MQDEANAAEAVSKIGDQWSISPSQDCGREVSMSTGKLAPAWGISVAKRMPAIPHAA